VAHDTAYLMPDHFFRKTMLFKTNLEVGIERVKTSTCGVVKTLAAIDVDAEFLRQSCQCA
jgi:hypothetical protein